MPERWTFGVDPLDQTVEAAALLRRLSSLVLSLEHDDPALAELIEQLRAAEQTLSGRVPAEGGPRVGAGVDRDGRAYIDHSRDIGAFNPAFPEYSLGVDGDLATGRVNFPIAYEGPPGIVHGGFLAVFFDCAMQHHNCDVGVAGKTTSLSMRYRRPTPLLTDLDVELSRSVDDRRITSLGRLTLDGELLCEAEMRAVVGSREGLPAVSPRKPAP